MVSAMSADGNCPCRIHMENRTMMKHISTGLIAIVTTSALAGNAAVAAPHAVVKSHASAAYVGRWGDAQARMPMPRDDSGGTCDFGDNPAIC